MTKPNLIRGPHGQFAKVSVDPTANTRKCAACKAEKSLEMFGNDKTGVLGKKGTCKRCETDAVIRYARKNPDKIRKLGRKLGLRRYGLSVEAYDELFESQGRACAVCGAEKSGGRSETFPVDHCHATDVVRGILCNNCNLLLGLANDDISVLEKAIVYLRGFTAVTSRNAIRKVPQ